MSKKINVLNCITLTLAVITILVIIISNIRNISYASSYLFAIITVIVYIINKMIIDQEKKLSNKDKEMLQMLKDEIKEGEKNG